MGYIHPNIYIYIISTVHIYIYIKCTVQRGIYPNNWRCSMPGTMQLWIKICQHYRKRKLKTKQLKHVFANRVPRKRITTICNQHFSRKQVPQIMTLFFTHNARVFLLINLGLAKFDEIGSNEFVNFEVMVLSWSGLCFSFGVSRRHL